jgi:hypothetical protein
MAEAPEIKVKLTAEDTGVAAAIKELTGQLKTLKTQQEETAASGFTLAKAFQGIVAAGALIKFGQIGRDAFESAINIGKMADKTGLTTQTLSVFHHVAEETGVATESVDKALTRGARSITEFEQGSARAAKGFQLLNITQKDFQGLNPDQKIALVTQRLGAMSAGFEKATATQIIFSRGGAEFIPVANAIAGEGFDKVTASVSKLGLLLDQETTDAFRSAKASMQELSDVGKGMATQFEAGLLPAISDVGEGLVDSLTQGGVSFQDLGRYAGEAVRGIAFIFLALGQTLGGVAESVYDVFSKVWADIKDEATTNFSAIGQALRGHIGTALNILSEGGERATNRVKDEVERQQAIYKSLGDTLRADVANLFPSEAEEERRRKARIGRLRPDKQEEAPEVTPALIVNAAEKAALALLERQLQDELAIHRAYAKQSAQVDSEMFEKGELSLKEYYNRRRAEVTADAAEEMEILRRGVEAANAEAEKIGAAKSKAATPAEADKLEAVRLAALTKVEELQTKIKETEINSATKIESLDAEEFKRREENQQKILEFHKLIDATRGKALEAAKSEIAIEQQKLQIVLAQSGASQQEIDKELARYAEVKTAEVEFTEQQKDGGAALKQLADQRAEIEDKVRTGQLFEIQGAEQIRDLEQSRIPVLQQIADQLLAQARATGDEQKITHAEDFQKQVNQIAVQANFAGQQIATIKQGLSSAITGGFTQFFGSLVQGTRSVGDAFRGLAAGVVNSLQQMASQMIAQLILTRLLKSALGGFAGGGLVGGGGGAPGHAEGGLIRGPGGPKSDSIPARVSPGEYIVRADAVSAFGVENLEAINRGLRVPSLERLSLPKFAEGGLVGNPGGGGGDSNITLGIGLDEGLILKHLTSKAAGNIILQHLTNNPKAAQKALSRSD